MFKHVLGAALILATSISLLAKEIDPAKPEPVKPGKPVPLNPATKPAVVPPKPDVKPATRPAPAKPATAPAAKKDDAAALPSNDELAKRILAAQAKVDKLHKVGHVDLTQPVLEKSPDFTIFGDQHLITTQRLIQRLNRARDDKSLKGVLLTFSANTGFNLAQAHEIRAALLDLKRAGKRTFAYADGYDTPTYIAASGATDVCLLQGGEIMIPGVGIETMFMKGLFDKVGVKADYVQIGEYKGADEQYTRTGPTDESRGELNKVVDGLYDVIVDTIAKNRKLSKFVVKQTIDDCIVSAQQAKERKLVDHLLSQDELRDLITDKLGGDINLLANYAEPQREKLDFSNPFALLSGMNKKPKVANKPEIAVISADGVIIDGEAEDGLLGGGGNVGSENIRKAFRIATRDDNVKAIVLRIDSPGGSALASEVMWQAVNAAAQEKPVIVSIGSMAASGGYYLASAGDHIFADPSAIIGSIGVVGGKFVLKDVFDKLGITTETFSRGQNAALFSMNEPWTDRQRKMVATWMKNTYDQFTQRVMVNRKDKIKDIDQVARGRIFIADQAKDLGMIDQIGGLTDAITYAAKEAELKDYDVKNVPESRSVIDMLTGQASAEDEARMPYRPNVKVSVDSPLNLMPKSVRQAFMRQVQVMQLLDKRPVMLVSPYVITVK